MLSERGIQGAKPRENQYEMTDEGDYGGGSLRLRIYPSGKKVFFGSHHHQGKRRTARLGPYPELTLSQARQALVRWVEESEQPPAALYSEMSVDEAFQLYMELHARPSKRSFAEDERRYRFHLKEPLGQHPLQSLQKTQLLPLLDVVVSRGSPVEANRLHALLSGFLRFAESRGWLTQNPFAGVRKPARETPRERVLEWDELALFWRETKSEGIVPQLLRSILVTAQRPGEIRRMRWEHLEDGWWNLPSTLTKNRRSHRVPLAGVDLPEKSGDCPWVFPNSRYSGPVDISSPGHAMHRITKAFSVPATAHDLRRTAITRMAELGVSELVLAAIANHTAQTITRRVYNRYAYDKEKQEALEMWREALYQKIASDH